MKTQVKHNLAFNKNSVLELNDLNLLQVKGGSPVSSPLCLSVVVATAGATIGATIAITQGIKKL